LDPGIAGTKSQFGEQREHSLFWPIGSITFWCLHRTTLRRPTYMVIPETGLCGDRCDRSQPATCLATSLSVYRRGLVPPPPIRELGYAPLGRLPSCRTLPPACTVLPTHLRSHGTSGSWRGLKPRQPMQMPRAFRSFGTLARLDLHIRGHRDQTLGRDETNCRVSLGFKS
jgi:hypothetical protein